MRQSLSLPQGLPAGLGALFALMAPALGQTGSATLAPIQDTTIWETTVGGIANGSGFRAFYGANANGFGAALPGAV